uniref:Large ribosomal subunit protein uL30-like ferredoxin-like fold domain-containing protein n=1 Tax=Oncorhynchus tshawytscha TaxID=74940 RepID=A0A8C8EPQ7_ONCTS
MSCIFLSQLDRGLTLSIDPFLCLQTLSHKGDAPKLVAEQGVRVIKLVPENLLKKRKAIKATKPCGQFYHSGLPFKRLEDFLKDSHRKHRDETRIRRSAHRPAPAMPSAKNRLAFAVRIRDALICRHFRLLKIFSGAFVKMNETSMAMLKMVEPYVALGFPNLKSVCELILKRGQAKINKRKVALTDNTLIEQHMGKYGIICLEDLIHEIYSVGMNFCVVRNYIWPFRLSVARHTARDKAGLLKNIGNPGPRGMDVNSIIRQLN